MISLPGLTLVTGRSDIAEEILRTFAGFVSQGMLPNNLPDDGQAPADASYNTADATLWFVEAMRAFVATTGRDDVCARCSRSSRTSSSGISKAPASASVSTRGRSAAGGGRAYN